MERQEEENGEREREGRSKVHVGWSRRVEDREGWRGRRKKGKKRKRGEREGRGKKEGDGKEKGREGG